MSVALPTTSTVVNLQVVWSWPPFSLFQQILETQHECGPFHRAMSIEIRVLPPARVPEPNVRLLIILRNIKCDFGAFPFARPLTFGRLPRDLLSWLQDFDVEFLAQFTKPKFKSVPDLGAAASRICPPLKKAS